MKCPRCHGTGKITEWVVTDTLSEYEFPCRKCNGTGEIEVTNEEWFCSLSIEEKAKWFCDHIGCSDCRFNEKCLDEQMGQELWENWLKAVHKE